MEMVLKPGSLSDDGVSWDEENITILYPELDSQDTTEMRPTNAVLIVVDKDHLILMFNTYPENMLQSNVTKSGVWKLLMKHSHDGGKNWDKSQELPVNELFSNLCDCCIPTYCDIGPGRGIKLESSGRLIFSENVDWPKMNQQTVFRSSKTGSPTYRIPALVFQDNDFLAFCEMRHNGSKDSGPMNMVFKRGSLGVNGVSWGKETNLYPEPDSPDTNKRRPMNAVPIVVDKDHLILMFNTYPENMSEPDVTNSDKHVWQLLIKHSYDGGKTWDKSQEISPDGLFQYKSGIPSYCAIGPGHGIKLESSGRLIVSGNVKWPKSKNQQNIPFVIVSDDDGKTWKLGGEIKLPVYQEKEVSGNECQPVDGGSENIVISCRTPGSIPRMQSYSENAGDKFTHSEIIPKLIGPTNGCQGSAIGFKAPNSNDGDTFWALFSNPAIDCTKERKNLSIRLSKDGCKTWSGPRQVTEDGSAYSDLTLFTYGDRLKAACLFEHNNKPTTIDFIIIDVINEF